MIVPGGISSIVEKGILFASLIMLTFPGEAVLFTVTVRLRQRTSTGGSDTINTLVLLASPEPDWPD